MKIVIDIGHARGTGARGNGYEEHDVCSGVAGALANALAAQGHVCEVVDFPEKDNRGDLVATVREINRIKPDFSISLHADASDNQEAHGGHVCYFPGSRMGVQLARAVAKHVCALLPGRAEGTVARRDLYVLKNTACPAVLVECGFITNLRDCALLVTSPETVARAIARGVQDFVKG